MVLSVLMEVAQEKPDLASSSAMQLEPPMPGMIPDMPFGVVNALSAGKHIAEITKNEINDMMASDIDKSLTPPDPSTPMFERGAYLEPENASDMLSPEKNQDNKYDNLDSETKRYMQQMHGAADRFVHTMDYVNDQKVDIADTVMDQNAGLTPSAAAKDGNDLNDITGPDQLQLAQRRLRLHAMQYANLATIVVDRLGARADSLDPALLASIHKDTGDLHTKMDVRFTEAIKHGDLNLDGQERDILGKSMDDGYSGLDRIENTANNSLNNDTVLAVDDESPSPSM